MKTKFMSMTAAGLALTGLMLAGCVPSLNPLYTEEDLIFEPKLVGVWAENAEAKERWTFEQAGEKDYRVIDRKSKRLNSSHGKLCRMPSSA